MHTVTRDEFDEWMQHPVTIALKKVLKEERETMKEGMLHDNYLNVDAVKGMCLAMQNVIDLEYEGLFND